MTMRITLIGLQMAGACSNQVRLFKRLFPLSKYPRGVTVTKQRVTQFAKTFDWEWAASHLLTREQWPEFVFLRDGIEWTTHDQYTRQLAQAFWKASRA